MPDKAEFIETGTFRVDRQRALDKLMRFQLPDPGMYLLPWLRAAIASRAEAVHILRVQGAQTGVEMRFGGEPFSGEELKDPYGRLFERRSEGNSRNRNLAIGILSVLRLEPQSVTVFSGLGPDRVRLKVESLKKDSIEPSEDPVAQTVLRVLWDDPSKGRKLADAHLDSLPRSCEASPIPIWVQGSELRRARCLAGYRDGLYFEEDGVHGWLSVPPYFPTESTLYAYNCGISLNAAIDIALPILQVHGYINDDQFSLNASQSGVVRNARFKKTMELAAGQARKLIVQLARSQESRLPETGRLLIEGSLLPLWKDRIDRGPASEQPRLMEMTFAMVRKAVYPIIGKDPKQYEELAAQVRWDARATSWLRGAFRNLKGYETDSKDPALKAVWEAPLFLSVRGGGLSLRQIEVQRQSLGYVPFSAFPLPDAALPFEAVWCTTPSEEAILEARFKGQTRNIMNPFGVFEQWALQASASEPSASKGPLPPPTLEAAGLRDLLIRDSIPGADGLPVGEAGLSAHPPERSAKLYFFEQGKPAGFQEMESILRFEAVVNFPHDVGSVRPEQPNDVASGRPKPTDSGCLGRPNLRRSESLDAVRKPVPEGGIKALASRAARRLYLRLNQEYDCTKLTPRNQAIRAHLRDCLLDAVSRASDGALGANELWIMAAPLFDFADAWLGYTRIKEDLKEGSAIFLAEDRRSVEGLQGKKTLFLDGLAPSALATLFPESAILDIPESGLRLMFKRVGPAEPLTGAEPMGMDLLAAILQKHGTLYDQPEHPMRKLLLKATGKYLAPWPGRLPDPLQRCVLELLRHLWMFRWSNGCGMTIEELGSLMQAGNVTYLATPVEGKVVLNLPDDVGSVRPNLRRSGSLDEAAVDLLLNDDEAALIARLWPMERERLVRADLRRQGPAPAQPPLQAPAPAVQAAPQAPSAPPPRPEELPDSLQQAVKILSRLKGRRGMKLPQRAIRLLRLDESLSGGPLGFGEEGVLRLNPKNSLVSAILSSSLAPEQQAAYLASMTFTAYNRLQQKVTDLDDVRFQEALTDMLLKGKEDY